MHVEIHGKNVPVTTSNHKIVVRDDTPLRGGRTRLSTILESTLFQQWADTIDPSFTVNKIEIGAVTMFGPRPGFIYLVADVVDEDGDPIPGAAFLRGDSVAILVELVSLKGRYAVLTDQARFPSGQYLLETPAGMTDGSGNFKGKALDELAEEVPALKGKFTSDHVRALSDEPIWISPGGCNERMGFYHLLLRVDHSVIEELQDSEGGEGDHEKIRIKVVPWKDLYAITDAKLQIALNLHSGKVIDNIEQTARDMSEKLDRVYQAIADREHLRWVGQQIDDKLLGGGLRRLKRFVKKLDL